MPKLTIDGIDYHSEDLSEYGQAQLASLQFLEGQLHKIKQEIAVFQTAKVAFAQELREEIKRSGLQPLSTEGGDGLSDQLDAKRNGA